MVISGDITEFGADNELKLAKQILDSLNKPWILFPAIMMATGQKAGRIHLREFLEQRLFILLWQLVFLGTHCGPNMRMGPGQFPRENIVWLDSTLKTLRIKHAHYFYESLSPGFIAQ